jgi:hypothetical protein
MTGKQVEGFKVGDQVEVTLRGYINYITRNRDEVTVNISETKGCASYEEELDITNFSLIKKVEGEQ